MNPVLIQLGPLQVTWTAGVFLLAILASRLMVRQLAKAHDDIVKQTEDVFLYSLVAGLLGGRLGYTLLHLDQWSGSWLSTLQLSPYSFSGWIGLVLAATTLWLGIRKEGDKKGLIASVVVAGGLVFMAIGVWMLRFDRILSPLPDQIGPGLLGFIHSGVFMVALLGLFFGGKLLKDNPTRLLVFSMAFMPVTLVLLEGMKVLQGLL